MTDPLYAALELGKLSLIIPFAMLGVVFLVSMVS